MATTKTITKEYEKEIKSIRDVYETLENWANENSLKLSEISSKTFTPEGNKFTYTEKRKYEKKISKDIKHEFTVEITINGEKNENFKGNVKFKIIGKISDSEKDNPRFNGLKLFIRRFIDVYIKQYDIRKTEEFEKTIDSFDTFLKQ